MPFSNFRSVRSVPLAALALAWSSLPSEAGTLRAQTVAEAASSQAETRTTMQPLDPIPGARVVTEFDDTDSDLRWYPQHDTVMGGRSSGGFQIEDGILRFTGRLVTRGGGFASIRSRETEMDLAGFEGVHLRVRGDGREYTCRLQQSGERRYRASYRSSFVTRDGEWQDVYLPFADFVPTWRGRILDRPAIDPARINMMGVTLADKLDGEFRIELDRVRAYPKFDLAAHRGMHRPLLLFTKDLADLQLLHQLRALQAAQKDCDDRQLLPIIVSERGGSRVGDRPLDESSAAELREQFEAPEGGFTAVLVGKDGTEKQRSSAKLDPAELFELIDSMPMRRAEIQERSARGAR